MVGSITLAMTMAGVENLEKEASSWGIKSGKHIVCRRLISLGKWLREKHRRIVAEYASTAAFHSTGRKLYLWAAPGARL